MLNTRFSRVTKNKRLFEKKIEKLDQIVFFRLNRHLYANVTSAFNNFPLE